MTNEQRDWSTSSSSWTRQRSRMITPTTSDDCKVNSVDTQSQVHYFTKQRSVTASTSECDTGQPMMTYTPSC